MKEIEMSTRCSILIEIPDKYIKRIFRYNSSMFNEEDWDNETCDEKSEDVSIKKKYLGIYCHFDGYPDGVGKELVNNYLNFSKAFNLILGGDCSVILDNRVRRYATREGEKWKYIQPRQLDKIQKVSDDSEYLYIFKDSKWYLYLDKYFIHLSKVIDDYDSYVRGYLDCIEDGESFNQTLRNLDLDKLNNE